MAEIIVSILGCRGSLPVSGTEYQRFGGATTCVRIDAFGEILYLDAGTGMLRDIGMRDADEASLFITHPHLDHIMGIAGAGVFLEPGKRLHIYGRKRNGLGIKEQIAALMSPPLWPVGTDALPAESCYHDLGSDAVHIGEHIAVSAMEGNHPGGCSIYRISCGGESIVFMTDCTVGSLEGNTPVLKKEFIDFAGGCSLLLIDGQYNDYEWINTERSSYGHSTWSMAFKLGRECGARRVRVIHHDPARSDSELLEAAAALEPEERELEFARDGEVIVIDVKD